MPDVGVCTINLCGEFTLLLLGKSSRLVRCRAHLLKKFVIGFCSICAIFANLYKQTEAAPMRRQMRTSTRRWASCWGQPRRPSLAKGASPQIEPAHFCNVSVMCGVCFMTSKCAARPSRWTMRAGSCAGGARASLRRLRVPANITAHTNDS